MFTKVGSCVQQGACTQHVHRTVETQRHAQRHYTFCGRSGVVFSKLLAPSANVYRWAFDRSAHPPPPFCLFCFVVVVGGGGGGGGCDVLVVEVVVVVVIFVGFLFVCLFVFDAIMWQL